VEAEAGIIAVVADALAELDVAASLAELAEAARWVRPAVDDSLAFAVTGGRHPVVEAALAAAGEAAFVPNDCDLSADPGGTNDQRHIWLLTGPNMAGKSTFLRQNALIAILAQMGSFVPATSARIGVVDRLFSRVGAADDLARGRSTFMVEMVETATILNQAGPRSLVILDEIGRGTATFDGLSIAWACVEHLHEVNRSRALFATHFHELTALAETLPRLANASVKVREWQGEVIFLHEVGPGAADRSYGIQVARLAGLPTAVTERAAEVLSALERGEQEREKTNLADDLPLFTATRPRGGAPAKPSAVEAALGEILPDGLTPREALDLLYRLKAMLDG
jgi:DNA mismatch repair protein MutS